MVILSVIAIMVVASIKVLREKPVWRSVSKIQVGAGIRMPFNVAFKESIGSYIRSQIEILNSLTLRERVFKRLDRENYPVPDEAGLRVSLEPLGSTGIIKIKVDSKDKNLANKYHQDPIDESEKFKQAKRGSSAEAALLELTRQINTLEKEIKEGEEKLIEFQKQYDIVAYEESGNLAARHVGELEYRLAQLSTQRKIIETQLKELKTYDNPYLIESRLARLELSAFTPKLPLPSKTPKKGETGGSVSLSIPIYTPTETELKVYQDLRREEERLQDELQDALKIYKEEHPRIKELRKNIDKVKKQIAEEIKNLREKLEARYNALKLEQKALTDSLRDWKKKVFTISSQLAEYENLKGRLERKKKLYNLLIQRMSEINVATGIATDIVQVVEEPHLLIHPVKPKPLRTLTLAFIVGLALGVGLVFSAEYLNDTIRNTEEFEKITSIPTFALIPRFNEWKDKKPYEKTIKASDLHSPVIEAFRNLRTTITFATPQENLKTILVTSSVPQEGKTQIAVNLAISLAHGGAKTILIDADLRKGNVHKYFRLRTSKGLSTYLLGKHSLKEVIQPTGIENLDILPCGKHPPHPAELISSSTFKKLLQELEKEYDRIVIDSPPVLNVSESIVLGVSAQGTLLIVKGGSTSRKLVLRAVELLRKNKVKIIGGVINNLGPAELDYHSYYYYYYYGYRYYGESSEESSS